MSAARSTAPVDPLGPEIAALRNRQRELEAAVGTGQSNEAWKRAQAAFDALDAALRVNPATTASIATINTGLATLRAALREGVVAASLWKEIRTNAETLRRLIDSTRRRGSAEDRLADREAERHARLQEALQESGVVRPAASPTARRPPRRRRPAP